MKTFKLEAVTPEKIAYSEDVESVVVPGKEGSLGILADHAPLMVELTTGEGTVREATGKTFKFAVSGGFMEVSNNVVRILADTIERHDEIDIERARAAAKRAQERIRASTQEDVDFQRAEAALKRALTRIRVAESDG